MSNLIQYFWRTFGNQKTIFKVKLTTEDNLVSEGHKQGESTRPEVLMVVNCLGYYSV
jgi:hypothetical protein